MDRRGAVVYARINLRTNDMYIGETDSFDRRVMQHYMATYKHGATCEYRPCRGCIEHTKYLRHRAAPAHAWLMVPLWCCDTKQEAKQLERWATRKWKPSLNAGDKPFWLLKHTYAQEGRVTRAQEHRREHTPWRQNSSRCSPTRTALLTTYDINETRVFDIGPVLTYGAEHNKAYEIIIQPGVGDMTNWKRLKERFGNSSVRVKTLDGVILRTTLAQWDGGKAVAQGAMLSLYIRPERRIDREQVVQGLIEIDSFAEQLENSSEEDLQFYWRCRKELDSGSRIKVRRMIWDECQRRYDGFTPKPIQLRIPYFRELDTKKVKRHLATLLQAKGWPAFLIEWHMQNTTVITESQPSVGEILNNVNQPWADHRGCKCAEIMKTLRDLGYRGSLPHTNGHIFFTGREYFGPCQKALRVAACNIPTQTKWDLERAWEKVRTQLPDGLCDKKAWANLLPSCTRSLWKARDTSGCPSTRDAYRLRKALRGLVIGPLDKNNGELWLCCPELYSEALQSAYSVDKGYEPVFPRKLSAQRRTKPSDVLTKEILQTSPAPQKEVGTDRDVVKAWEVLYKRYGWNKIATFNKSGGFNRPYILFKAKNVTDPEIRKSKWKKVRPIAPGTRHPMHRLLGLVGRAWSFVTSQMPGDHMVINKCQEVPQFLKEAERLSDLGQIDVIVRDIESCYPSMPQEAIRFGLLDTTRRITRELGYDGVMVPKRSKNKPCSWKHSMRGGVWLSFELMQAVMEFTLDNAFVMMPDGQLRRQAQGIPMGLELAPGMTIGACGWMEHEWALALSKTDRRCFRSKRYMDDICLVYAKPQWWDHERFLSDFEKSECYMDPLKLEPGKEGTFLETCFKVEGNRIRTWLKNDNVVGKPAKIWRYHHFHSHAPFRQKRATLISCLRKVEAMASDDKAVWDSALDKIAEFQQLGYPRGMLWDACSKMGATSRNRTWFDIRDGLQQVGRPPRARTMVQHAGLRMNRQGCVGQEH